MSAMLHDRPVLPGSVSGRTAGRRVMTRWARRLLRREWRQQILVLALLALTVGASTFGVAAAYNVASLPGPQFGSASYLLQFAGTDQKTMTADITAARKAFGTVQVIGRQFVPVPGSAQTVEYRAMNPDGPYSGPMLALVRGHYPAGAGQVAVHRDERGRYRRPVGAGRGEAAGGAVEVGVQLIGDRVDRGRREYV